jgi:hypothetical protein
MAKIPSYDPSTDLDGTEEFVADQTGGTVKVTTNKLKTYIGFYTHPAYTSCN